MRVADQTKQTKINFYAILSSFAIFNDLKT
jgi:hypothetical protein